MAGPEWVPTVSEAAVPEGGYVAAYPKGVGVLVARVEGQLYALANKCVHMGCSLEGGRLHRTILTCPCHDWRFDIRDGHFVTAPELAVATFPTLVENGTIHVRMRG